VDLSVGLFGVPRNSFFGFKLMGKIFVFILITLDVCASVFYFIQKDPARGIYWFTAGVLSATTLVMK
jgi:hypothetical protein